MGELFGWHHRKTSSTTGLPRGLPKLALILALAAAACSHSTLPGTRIRDTTGNRQIFGLLEELRDAFERRDSAHLLSMLSPMYFEDNGTPSPQDDYGFLELRERLLEETLNLAKEVHLSLEIYDIVVQGDYAFADVRYSSRARLELPEGRLWDSHRDFNRLEFVRESGAWKVISGL